MHWPDHHWQCNWRVAWTSSRMCAGKRRTLRASIGAYLDGGPNRRPPPKLSKVWNLVSWLSGKSLKLFSHRCQILRLKCTKFNFGWGSAPDPAGVAYSAPPDPLTGLMGPISRGRGRDGMGSGSEGTGRGGGRKGEGGDETPPLHAP